jgi:glutathione S-transferase
MAIRFYSWPMSSGSRAQWALEELGLPYEYVQLDRSKGEHKAPPYLAINPSGKIPALVDGDETYFESAAIIMHLGEKYGVERKLWPASGQDRADALSWSVWSMTELHTFALRYIYHGLDSPISYKPEQRSQAAAEFNLASTKRNLAMLDARLASREFLLGSFTLVDVIAGSTVRFAKMMGVPMEGVPHVTAWLARLAARPALAKVR